MSENITRSSGDQGYDPFGRAPAASAHSVTRTVSSSALVPTGQKAIAAPATTTTTSERSYRYEGFAHCISYDFDGVLHEHAHWRSSFGTIDTTLIDQAHARRLAVAISTCNDTWRICAELAKRGYKVRDDNANPVGGSLRGSHGWNGGKDGKAILVTNRKVCATAYVDDKAVRYHYHWGPDALWDEIEREQGYHYCPGSGHHWGPDGAAGILPWADHDGRIWVALAQRTAAVQGGSCWSTIGGAIDPDDESALAAAEREAAEEVVGLVYASEQDEPGYTDPCPHGCGWFYQTFPVQVEYRPIKVNPSASWETREVRWFPLDVALTMTKDLHPGLAGTLPALVAMIRDAAMAA